MYKNIRYKGISTNVSDYECPDGELTDTINMESGDVGMRVPVPPSIIINLKNDDKILFIHKTKGAQDKTHYIIQQGASLVWISADDTAEPIVYTTIKTNMVAKDVKAVGNTLVVLSDRGMYYFLWKNTEYIDLGQMPEMNMRFSLLCKVEKEKAFIIHLQDNPDSTDKKLILKEGEDRHIYGNINKFIADYSVNRGRFIFPFLVRYAYRLYDGTLTMHSAPVLMQCSDLVAPCICGDNFVTGKKEIMVNISAATQTLFYAVNNVDINIDLKKWSDIIKSVDVFISKPIYTFNQAGELIISQSVNEAKTAHAMKSISVCKLDPDSIVKETAAANIDFIKNCNYNQPRTYRDLYLLTYRDISKNLNTPEHETELNDLLDDIQEVVKVPAIPRGDVMKTIRDTHNFYLLKSIPIDKLEYQDTNMDIPDNYLQSLTSREVMTDDYDTHCKLVPEVMYTYNSRLNLANVTKYLYNGGFAGCQMQKTNGYAYITMTNDGVSHKIEGTRINFDTEIDIYVKIKKDGKEFVTKSAPNVFGYVSPVFYFFFPDKDAYEAMVHIKSNNNSGHGHSDCHFTIPLKPHDFLNGAVFSDTPGLERDFFSAYKAPGTPSDFSREFAAWMEVAATNGNKLDASPLPDTTLEEDYFVKVPNKIYTSPAYNPFFFPLVGINTVGSGEIIGLASATKALSEGQFGQFPLYAFTSEGIWALELTADGRFSSVQPVTRDTCISKEAITSADNSVLFLTKRSLMLLSGSKAISLSDNLKENSFIKVSSLPGYEELLIANDLDSYESTSDFTKYLIGAAIIYDYLNRRIIVYNPNRSYVYVYNIDTETWGKMSVQIAYHLNSYPEALGVTTDALGKNTLVDFSATRDVMLADINKCSFFTRPIKFEQPDMYKTVRTVIQNGRFRRGIISQVLYGSNDLIKWFPVRSSNSERMTGFSGTPYKFFIIAVTTPLRNDEYVEGCNIEYEPKLNNKLR